MNDAITYAKLRVTSAGFQAITDVLREASESGAPPDIMEGLFAMHQGLRMKLELIRAEFEEDEPPVVDIDARELKGKSEDQIREAILNAMPDSMRQ